MVLLQALKEANLEATTWVEMLAHSGAAKGATMEAEVSTLALLAQATMLVERMGTWATSEVTHSALLKFETEGLPLDSTMCPD